MAYIFSSSLLYLASVLFFHADPKRTDVGWAKESTEQRRIMWWGGTAAMVLSFIGVCAVAKLEVAIPYWLGLGALFGAVSLFVSALAKPWHVLSGAAAAVLSVASGVTLVAGAFS
ncbi:MAG: hypothetical protein AAGI89_06875 [Pseudomonadota bacterium]